MIKVDGLGSFKQFSFNLYYVPYQILLIGFMILPFSTGIESGLVISPGLPLIILAVLVIMITRHKMHFAGKFYLITILILVIFAFTNLFTSFVSIDAPSSLWRSSLNVLGLLIFIIFIHYDKFKLDKRKFLARIIVSYGTMISSYYIINFIFQAIKYGLGRVLLERFVGGLASLPWGASNVIAACLLMATIVACVEYLKTQRNSLAVSIIIMSLAILLTFSRTVGIVFMLFLFGFVIISRKIKLVLTLILLVGITIYVTISDLTRGSSSDLSNFLSERLGNTDLNNANGRYDIWSSFMSYYIDHPLSINGYYSSLEKFGYSGHNIILTTLVEQGMFGVIALLLLTNLLLYSIWQMLKRIKTRREGILLLLGFICIVIGLQFEDPNFTQQYILMFWLFITYILIVKGDGRNAGNVHSYSELEWR